MSIAYTDTQHYSDIADAIRAKNGSADQYTPSEMATAISAVTPLVVKTTWTPFATPSGNLYINPSSLTDSLEYVVKIKLNAAATNFMQFVMNYGSDQSNGILVGVNSSQKLYAACGGQFKYFDNNLAQTNTWYYVAAYTDVATLHSYFGLYGADGTLLDSADRTVTLLSITGEMRLGGNPRVADSYVDLAETYFKANGDYVFGHPNAKTINMARGLLP